MLRMVCRYDLWLYMLVWWWIKVYHLAGSKYCGELNSTQICKGEYRIQFYPYANNTMKQWWVLKNSTYSEIRNGSAEYLLVDLSLVIRNITTCENVTFVVECNGSNRLISRLPFDCTTLSATPPCSTVTEPSLGKQPPTPITYNNKAVMNDNSIVIIVVAVCITVIVLVIASTIVIIACKPPIKARSLMESDVNIAQAHPGCGKDNGEVTDCAQQDMTSINSSNTSKTLNSNVMILSNEQNEYAVIRDSDVGMYSDIKPKSLMRSRSRSSLMRSGECIAEAPTKVYDIPKKVKTVSGENDNERRDTDMLNKFSVKFPEIDMNVINQCLESDTTNKSEVHTYSNAMRRSQRKKSGSKYNELQYAMISRPSSEINTEEPLCRRLEEHKTNRCQYANIDFNKTAFVAPVRKAPSSWYKRRNKQKLPKQN